MLLKSDLEVSLERVIGWIRASDQKASIFLAFQGFVITIIFSSVYHIIRGLVIKISCLNLLDLFIYIVALFLIVFSFYKSLVSIIPKIKTNEKKSLIFFLDIAGYSLSDYENKINNAEEDEYKKNLIEAIHQNSKIALKKYIALKNAIIVFLIGIIFLFIGFIFYKIN